MKVAVLFCRKDSDYKTIEGVDCYDSDRNALTFKDDYPVIAHPPCRAWGVLSHMAKPREGEKELALWAVDIVRKNGGVLEHPYGSRLWKEKPLPKVGEFPDEFGGFTVEINQYWFGHVASKPTKLYICGCKQYELPAIPYKDGKALKSITGGVPGTSRCTQREREYTPKELREWLIKTAILCGAQRKETTG